MRARYSLSVEGNRSLGFAGPCDGATAKTKQMSSDRTLCEGGQRMDLAA